MAKSSNKTCYFKPHYFANLILDYNADEPKMCELKTQGSSEYTIDDKQIIKDVCIKLKVDRLGNVIEVDGKIIG